MLHFVTNFLYFCITSQNALEQARNIALNGSTEEKNSFVAWCHDAITYNSKQLAYGGNDEYRYSLYRVKAQYAVYFDAMTAFEEENNVKALMEYSGMSRAGIYKIAAKLGRLPTREELDNRPKVGRPKKYN